MIGIVGFGRFGKLMARYLGQDFKVRVYDRHNRSTEIRQTGCTAAPLEDVCGQDIVILAVPISSFGEVLAKIKSFLKPDALVVDVCSVKEYPVKLMREILPDTVSILATHPMFGPDSAAKSLDGGKIALCKERLDEKIFQKIKSYLSRKGLIVIETTARQHDQQIAVSLALTHFIGRSLSEFGAGKLNLDTEGYKRLLHILGVVEHDTWQLFLDMHHYNPYAREKRIAFMEAMQKVEASLNK